MGNLYQNNITNELVISGTSYLIAEPEKSDQVKIVLNRDRDFHGFSSEFLEDEIKLEFTCFKELGTEQNDAKTLIEQYYQFFGTDTNIGYQIKMVDCGTGIESVLFSGSLNMNDITFQDDRVLCTIERVGFEDLVRSRWSSKIDALSGLTLDGKVMTPAPVVNLRMHSKVIEKTNLENQTFNTSGTDFAFFNFFIPGGIGTSNHSQIYITQLETFNEFATKEIEESFAIPTATQLNFPFPSPRLQVKELGNFQFDIDLKLQPEIFGIRTGGVPGTLLNCGGSAYWNDIVVLTKLRITDVADVDKFDITIATDSYSDASQANTTCGAGSTYIFNEINPSYSNNFDLAIDDKIYLYTETTVTGLYNKAVLNYTLTYDVTLNINTDSTFKVTANTQVEETSSAAVMIYETLDKTLEGATGVSDALRSTLLGRTDSSRVYGSDGCGALLSTNNGFFIRGFPSRILPDGTISTLEDAKTIHYSLADIIESLQSCYNVGFGFEKENSTDILRVEAGEYFYQDNEILTITNPSNYKVDIDTQFLINYIEQGFEKWADEQVNNLDEFASKQEYSTGIKSFKNKRSMISKYLASGYLIEFTRRMNYQSNPTTDTEQDNNNFIIALVREGTAQSITATVNIDAAAGTMTVLQPINIAAGSSITITGSASNDGVYIVQSVAYTEFNSYTVIDLLALLTNEIEVSITLDYTANSPQFAPQKDENFDSVTGIISPTTAYNLRLSPKRCLLRAISFVKSALTFKGGGHEIQFTFNEGSATLETVINVSQTCEAQGTIKESDNILLNDYGAGLFICEKHSFNANLSSTDLLALKAALNGEAVNNYGYISVTDFNNNVNKIYVNTLKYSAIESEVFIEGIKKNA